MILHENWRKDIKEREQKMLTSEGMGNGMSYMSSEDAEVDMIHLCK